jgi:hypothetical protein
MQKAAGIALGVFGVVVALYTTVQTTVGSMATYYLQRNDPTLSSTKILKRTTSSAFGSFRFWGFHGTAICIQDSTGADILGAADFAPSMHDDPNAYATVILMFVLSEGLAEGLAVLGLRHHTVCSSALSLCFGC